MVSMAIALGSSPETASLLILDEATAAIPEDEADPYLRIVRGVARSGVPVLMVTHRVKEVPSIADRVTVLADGAVVHTGDAANVDDETIISLMVSAKRSSAAGSGSPSPEEVRTGVPAPNLAGLWQSGPVRKTFSGAHAALEVDQLCTSVLKDVSFTVAKGEIVGAAGLPDSGIADLPLAVAGALPVSSGRILVNGRGLPRACSPAIAIGAGVGLVPADRLRQGVISTLSMRENLILPQFGRFWRRRQAEQERVSSAIATLGIRPSAPQVLMGQLSGGNQQKVVIGKWLLMGPDLLVLDDPTYGVDPAARQSVFQIMRECAHQGLGILLLSTEPEQLVLVCSRILVFRGGSLIKVLQEAEMTRENVARWSSL
jgi:ribose transport system ATP-binding protein